MTLNPKQRGFLMLLLAGFLTGCSSPASVRLANSGMQPLTMAEAPTGPLPTTVVDQLPTITRLSSQQEAIVFQAQDALLATDPLSGETARWQVNPLEASALPVNDEPFQLRHFILWRDGTFYNLPAVHEVRQVDLSPDGQMIAYSSRTAPFLIHLGTVDGEAVWRWPHAGHNPTWSPDGQRLAFYGWDDIGESIHLYTANVDGSDLISLMELDYPAGDILAPELAWSPDGRRLAMLDNLTTRTTKRLYTLYPDGRKPTLLHELTDARLNDLRWSPDGSKLAFLSIASTGGDRRLLVLDAGRGDLLADYADVHAFAWSPDSSQLAMGVCPYEEGTCTFDVYLGSANSGQRNRLTHLAMELGGGLDVPEAGQFIWLGGSE